MFLYVLFIFVYIFALVEVICWETLLRLGLPALLLSLFLLADVAISNKTNKKH